MIATNHDAPFRNWPHPLAAGRLSVLLGFLARSEGLRRGNVDARLLARLLATSAMGSPFRMVERISPATRRALRQPPRPPVFVIGHWRSGTTFLHNLLTQDPRFGFCSTEHVLCAGSFLTLPKRVRALLHDRLRDDVPDHRPMDGVGLDWESPQEEEFALARLSNLSYFHAFFFPARATEIFERAVLLEDAGVRERWKALFDWLLRRLSYDQEGKTLCLKNPANTARLRPLLELYPEARFVCLVRDPEQVFRSTRHLWRTMVELYSVTGERPADLDETVLDVYERLMRRYLADRAAIPPERLVEVRYEDLADDPIGTIEAIYDRLGLDAVDAMLPAVKEHLDAQRRYRTNPHDLSPDERRTVRERWAFAFEAWGYDGRPTGRQAMTSSSAETLTTSSVRT